MAELMTGSICWECARACGIEGLQCSWFGKAHKIPHGARYEMREAYNNLGKGRKHLMEIYSIQECPKYLEETAEVKAKLKHYRVAKLRKEHPTESVVKLYRLMLGDGVDGRKK